MNNTEVKQKLFLRFNEFKPLLNKEQYKVYVKHIEFAFESAAKSE